MAPQMQTAADAAGFEMMATQMQAQAAAAGFAMVAPQMQAAATIEDCDMIARQMQVEAPPAGLPASQVQEVPEGGAQTQSAALVVAAEAQAATSHVALSGMENAAMPENLHGPFPNSVGAKGNAKGVSTALTAEQLESIRKRRQAAKEKRVRRQCEMNEAVPLLDVESAPNVGARVEEQPFGDTTREAHVDDAASTPLGDISTSGEPQGEGGNICALCQFDLRTRETQALPCACNFHADCLHEYMRMTGMPWEACCPFKCYRSAASVALDCEAPTPAPQPSDLTVEQQTQAVALARQQGFGAN